MHCLWSDIKTRFKYLPNPIKFKSAKSGISLNVGISNLKLIRQKNAFISVEKCQHDLLEISIKMSNQLQGKYVWIYSKLHILGSGICNSFIKIIINGAKVKTKKSNQSGSGKVIYFYGCQFLGPCSCGYFAVHFCPDFCDRYEIDSDVFFEKNRHTYLNSFLRAK